jgi:hypothetical protein
MNFVKTQELKVVDVYLFVVAVDPGVGVGDDDQRRREPTVGGV